MSVYNEELEILAVGDSFVSMFTLAEVKSCLYIFHNKYINIHLFIITNSYILFLYVLYYHKKCK